MRQKKSYSPIARRPLNSHGLGKRTSILIPKRPKLKFKYERIHQPSMQHYSTSSSSPDDQNEQTLRLLSPMAALAFSHQKRLSHDRSSHFLKDIRQSEFPIPAQVALFRYKHFFSEYEKTEIQEYTHIYFLGLQAHKPSAFVDNEGFYIAPIADQIAYRYEITEEISRGAFGLVLRCFDHRSQQMVAIKILKNNKECQELGKHEALIFDKLSSHSQYDKHVVRLHSTFVFRGHFCFAMEALDISLLQHIESVEAKGMHSMSQMRTITTQILLGLKFLHSIELVHADLKPENILFQDKDKSSVKLIDFGTSAILGCKEFNYVQSRHYRAPEVVFGMKYRQSADMWSLGCVLYEMYTGFLLFPARNEQELIAMICKVLGEPPLSLIMKSTRAHNVSKQHSLRAQSVGPPRANSLGNLLRGNDKLFVEFLEGLLRWDPSARMTADEALEHPWAKCTEKKTNSFKQSFSPVRRKH